MQLHRHPVQLGSLAKLQELMLYSNQLSGPIPESLGTLGNLGTLTNAGDFVEITEATEDMPPMCDYCELRGVWA